MINNVLQKVEPFASIIEECPKSVPRVLMNKHLVGPFKKSKNASGKKDVTILGDLVLCLDTLVQSIGWEKELDELVVREMDLLVGILFNTLYYMWELEKYNF